MSTKTQKTTKKVVAAGTAAVLCATSMLAGTLAWQSLNQEATNVLSGVVNPGGRLHDDFDGKEEKNVYVENFGTQKIYARVQLLEFLEKYDGITEAAVKDKLADPEEYTIYYYGENSEADRYWKKIYGENNAVTSYIPTFDKNNTSLAADLNGFFEDDVYTQDEDTGAYTITEFNNDTINRGNGWANYSGALDSGAVTATAKYGETTGEDETEYQTSEETHFVSETLGTYSGLMSVDDFLALSVEDQETTYCWVYDEYGYFYWSQPIDPAYKEREMVLTWDNADRPKDAIPTNSISAETRDRIDLRYIGKNAPEEGSWLISNLLSDDNKNGSPVSNLWFSAHERDDKDEITYDLVQDKDFSIEKIVDSDGKLHHYIVFNDSYVADGETKTVDVFVNASQYGAYICRVILTKNDNNPTTGLLLDGLEDLEAIDEDYVYALKVDAQFVTANQLYKDSDSTEWDSGFFDTSYGEAPEGTTIDFLRAIGAITIDENDDDDWEEDGGGIYISYDIEWDGNVYFDSIDEFINTGITFTTYENDSGEQRYDAEWGIDNDVNFSAEVNEDGQYIVKYIGEDEEIDQFSFTVSSFADGFGNTDTYVTVVIGQVPESPAIDTPEELNNALAGMSANEILDLDNAEITAGGAQTEYEDNPEVGKYHFAWTTGGELYNGTVTMGSEDNERAFSGLYVEANEEVYIENFTINAGKQTMPLHINAVDDVTLENVYVSGNRGGIYANGGNGTITMNNVTVDASNNWDLGNSYVWYNSAIGVANGADVVINGGNYSGENAVWIFSSGGSVTINDGTFSGNLVADAGTLTICGGTFDHDPTAYVDIDNYTVTPNDDTNPTSWTVEAN